MQRTGHRCGTCKTHMYRDTNIHIELVQLPHKLISKLFVARNILILHIKSDLFIDESTRNN